MIKGKKWYKVWWIWAIVVVVLVIASSATSSVLSAEEEYDTKEIKKGTPTGYEKVLGNGDFIVGQDIEPGLYNVTGLGWADVVNSGLNIVNQNDDGTYSNLTLKDGDKLSVLDQSNSSMGVAKNTVKEGEDITFIKIQEEDQKSEHIVEKLEVDPKDNSEVCYKNDKKVDCSELTKYDQLKQDIEKEN